MSRSIAGIGILFEYSNLSYRKVLMKFSHLSQNTRNLDIYAQPLFQITVASLFR
jgi:hypothetical protein